MPVLRLPHLGRALDAPWEPSRADAVGGDRQAAPDRIGPYVLEAVIGRGGCAVVYRAWDPTRSVQVAIKVAAARSGEADHTAMHRLRHERRALHRAACPDVVAVLDAGRDGAREYLVLEMAEGGALSERVRAGVLGGRRATARVGTTVARALSRAHAAGLVHRDVTPANIFVLGRDAVPPHRASALVDQHERLVLGDFGLAAPLGAPAAEGDRLPGVPRFCSPAPDTGAAEVTPADDVYGATAVIFTVMSGRMPPRCEELDAVLEQLRPRWRSFVTTGLNPDPRARFASIGEWHGALIDALELDPREVARRALA